MKKDLIVIGAGPCGATAAIYAKRAGLDVLVIDSGASALLKADKIENYYGFESVSGKELFEKGLMQLRHLKVEMVFRQALSAVYGDGFVIKTYGKEYESTALLIASGAKRTKPPAQEFESYLGRGASYCAVCDGFFFRGKDVGVIGAGEYALSEARELARMCKSVCILTDGAKPEADFSEFSVNTGKITGIEGKDSIEAVILDDKKIKLSGLFAAVGVAGAADFARRIGAQVKGADIVVNDKFETNVPGLYAAGDCIFGIKQIGTAVGAGVGAAMQIIKFIRSR